MKECRWRGHVAPSPAAPGGSSATGGPRRRTLRQGLVALALSTAAGFVAGLTLAHITGTLAALPGLADPDPGRGRDEGHDLRRDRRAPGHRERGRRAGDQPGARRGPAPQRRRGDPHDVLVVPVARPARAVRRRRCSGSRRSRSATSPSISVFGGALGSVLVLADHGRPVRALLPAGVGPRFRFDADGDGARRHDHAPQPVPRDVPGAQRTAVAAGVGVVAIGVAVAATVRSYVGPRPPRAPHRVGDDGDDRCSRRSSTSSPAGCSRRGSPSSRPSPSCSR